MLVFRVIFTAKLVANPIVQPIVKFDLDTDENLFKLIVRVAEGYFFLAINEQIMNGFMLKEITPQKCFSGINQKNNLTYVLHIGFKMKLDLKS
ncbi:hypothetical protein TUM4249_35790 [Shewanella sp. KT0246]|nr:hypothetical protein TUM4249_35790 [Shewanella sp. KT0246]